MKILITGYYGAGNFGDDIMLEALCKGMRKSNKDIKLDIFKMFDKELKIDLDKDIKVVNFYKIKRLRRLFFKMLIKKYDLFLWGGGTCFTDEDGDGLYDYMKMAKEAGVKIAYIGVGVGKLTKDDRIDKTKYLMNNADIITLRDINSYRYALDIVHNKKNVYLTEDLAYLFVNNLILKNNVNRDTSDVRKVIISWRNLVNYKTAQEENELIIKLIEFIKTIIDENKKTEYVILPLDDRRDLDINKKIYNELKLFENNKSKFIYLDNLSPLEKIKEILNSDINISARLHGIFVSEIANIKTIGMSYSIKINEFLDSIGKLEDCIEIGEITKEELMKKYELDLPNIERSLIEKKVSKSIKNIEILNSII